MFPVHVDQVRRYGDSELDFACAYGKGFLDAGNYRDNWMEVEAYKIDDRPLPPACHNNPQTGEWTLPDELTGREWLVPVLFVLS